MDTSCTKVNIPDLPTALRLLRQHFLNRTDRLAFLPSWAEAPCPVQAGDNLDAMLLAHFLGDQAPAVTVTWGPTKKGSSGEITGRFRLGTYSPALDGTTVYAVVDFDGGGRHGFALVDPLGCALAFMLRCQSFGLTV